MFGMMKKDFLMVRNNYKSIVSALVLYIFYTIMFEMDMSFLLPFMSLMIVISTFHYDEFNHWYSYVSVLPEGKVNVVKSKYIITICIILFTSLLSFFMGYVISYFRGNVVGEEFVSTMLGELVAIVFMISLLFPVLFKFGSEKGRTVMMLISLFIVGVVFLVTKFARLEMSEILVRFFDLYFVFIFIGVSIVMLLVSYLVSKKIYLNKDF